MESEEKNNIFNDNNSSFSNSASPIQSSAAVAAAAFAHLNSTYLDAASQRNTYVSSHICMNSLIDSSMAFIFIK